MVVLRRSKRLAAKGTGAPLPIPKMITPEGAIFMVEEMCTLADIAAKNARQTLDDAKSAFNAYKDIQTTKNGPAVDAAFKNLENICSKYGICFVRSQKFERT